MAISPPVSKTVLQPYHLIFIINDFKWSKDKFSVFSQVLTHS